MDFWSTVYSTAGNWLASHWVAIAAIILGTFIVHRVAAVAVERLIRQAVRGTAHDTEHAEKKREDTLIKIANSTMGILIWILAGLMLLSEFGFNIGPLLAAAGVAGLAFGFGGQYLIRDIISGLFIILENQYRVGDVADFDGTAGLVEDITLRMTTLRDLDGNVHHVPHGAISKVTNMSKGFARVNINIGIGYASNLEQVEQVVNKVGDELFNDPNWSESVMEAPKFLRVEEFADSAIVIKILGKTQPLKQWDVAGELRKRLKIAFDREGIEIPFPQRVVNMVNVNPKS